MLEYGDFDPLQHQQGADIMGMTHVSTVELGRQPHSICKSLCLVEERVTSARPASQGSAVLHYRLPGCSSHKQVDATIPNRGFGQYVL